MCYNEYMEPICSISQLTWHVHCAVVQLRSLDRAREVSHPLYVTGQRHYTEALRFLGQEVATDVP